MLLLDSLSGDSFAAGPVRVFRKRSTDDFTGWTVWGCSPVFARLAIERPELFDGKNVLELGAGCGLAGLAVACCTKAASICISDYPVETMRNMLHNIALNCERIGTGSTQEKGSPLHAADAAETGAPITAVLGGESFSTSDVFFSGTGCHVSIAQIDWDIEETWPRVASAAGPTTSPFRQYDVIIAADLLPRESYGRSLAHVVRGLLKPGGSLIAVTPAVREGLPILAAALRGEAGYAVAEECVADEWRENPLRSPEQAAGVEACPPSHGHCEPFGGAARPTLPPSALSESLKRAGCDDRDGSSSSSSAGPTTSSSAPLRYVTADAASDMFPELSRPSYDILAVTFTRPPTGTSTT
jgi:predicted nicotinamide N-methyase